MPKTETQTSTINDTEYKAAVEEGKQVAEDFLAAEEQAENFKMRLGELADGVAKKYGDKRLDRYAKDIGMVACTLGRCRSVYRAWHGVDAAAYEAQTGKKATPPISFSVAQDLQRHPDRFDIIKNDPDISSRAARRKVRQYKKEQNTASGFLLENTKKWFAAVCKRAGEQIRDADITDKDLSPQLQETYIAAVKPSIALLETLRDAGNANLRLADFLERLIKEGPAPRSDKDEAWDAMTAEASKAAETSPAEARIEDNKQDEEPVPQPRSTSKPKEPTPEGPAPGSDADELPDRSDVADADLRELMEEGDRLNAEWLKTHTAWTPTKDEQPAPLSDADKEAASKAAVARWQALAEAAKTEDDEPDDKPVPQLRVRRKPDPEFRLLFRQEKLGAAVYERIKGTSLDKPPEMDALILLGEMPGDRTIPYVPGFDSDRVDDLVARAEKGEAVSAVARVEAIKEKWKKPKDKPTEKPVPPLRPTRKPNNKLTMRPTRPRPVNGSKASGVAA
jgi:hypothetical protein